MEKTNINVHELLTKINRMTNKEFSKEILFITYLLKENPYNDDFKIVKHYWFESNDFVNDWKRVFELLDDYSEKGNGILRDLIIDAEKTIMFYLGEHAKENSTLYRIVMELVNSATTKELRELLLKYFDDERSREMLSTSSSVVKLSKRLLSIHHGESVLDLCSGKGRFLSSINETDDLTGIEINNDNLKDAYLYCLLNGIQPILSHQDALTFGGKRFDKIFCEYPWGYTYNRPLQSLGCEKWSPLPIKDLKRSMTSWLFIAKALSLLEKNGVAVIHCNDGALFSTYERDVRKLAINNGLIKAVISMPQRMHYSTGVSSSILILSYGNKSVRFIDASSFGVVDPQTKCKVLGDEDIKKIIALLNSDVQNERAVTINNNKIEESYLNVARYLQPTIAPVTVKHGKKLEDVIDLLIQSVVANSSFLTDDSLTGIKVLSSSDIKDGTVDIAKLPYLSKDGLSSLPKNWDKFILQNGDVVMTNKSTVIKSAIVDINGEKVVLFGSLYGIRVKLNQMLPAYLCTFINSNAGQMLLKTIQTGTVISMITRSNLKNLVVPCPDILEQAKVCENISIILEMIRDSKERIIKLQKTYESSFDELLTEE